MLDTQDPDYELWSPTDVVQILALSLTSCVTLGKLVYISTLSPFHL